MRTVRPDRVRVETGVEFCGESKLAFVMVVSNGDEKLSSSSVIRLSSSRESFNLDFGVFGATGVCRGVFGFCGLGVFGVGFGVFGFGVGGTVGLLAAILSSSNWTVELIVASSSNRTSRLLNIFFFTGSQSRYPFHP